MKKKKLKKKLKKLKEDREILLDMLRIRSRSRKLR
jgi:hypothetical protein